MEKDLGEIRCLCINDRSNFDFNELTKYPNLEAISFSTLKFSDAEVSIINSLTNLKYLYFDFCTFSCENEKLKLNVEDLIFNVCFNLKLEFLEESKIQKLKIVGIKPSSISYDLTKLPVIEGLHTIKLNRMNISNVKYLLKISSIREINLDGSITDEELIDDNILISHDEFYRIEESQS